VMRPHSRLLDQGGHTLNGYSLPSTSVNISKWGFIFLNVNMGKLHLDEQDNCNSQSMFTNF
jgi:hypothetical protein